MFSYAGKSNGVQPTTPTTDPNFKQVSLLLHGDGTNGTQNNTFIDSSSNNFTVTRTGTPTQGTYTPFSQSNGYWSNYFPTASYLTIPTNAAFTYGTSDFTMECWVYLTTTGAIQYIIDQRNSGTANAVIPAIYVSASNVLTYFVSNAAQITGSTALSANTWYHVAVSKSSGSTKMFLNGTQEGSTYTDANNYASSRVTINSNGATAGNYLVGYTSNVRLVKGTAVYTSNFTPSTTPLTAISGTSLLTCQSNYFLDNSSNNFSITVTGTPQVQPWSPFAPTSAYSTSVNGGSGYFNGTTDYLTVANNANLKFGSSDFTIEFWVYVNTITGNHDILGTAGAAAVSNDSFLIYQNAATLRYYLSSTGTSWNIASAVSIGTVTVNQWYHVALVRNGSTFTPYLNGFAGTTTTNASALFAYTGTLNTGFLTAYYNGYISNLRIVNGTAVYTSNFTPPTAPVTAISGTQLLLNNTNAGIYDNAIKNDLITAGAAQVNTSVVKYGTGSMSFNGTTSYLQNKNPNFAGVFGTGNFTVEYWIYPNSFSTAPTVFDTRTTGTSSNPNGYADFFTTSGLFNLYFGSTVYTSSTAISTNTWTHIAVTRSGTSIRVFFNGTQNGSTVTNSSNLTDNVNIFVGVNVAISTTTPSTNYFNGYVDDLRVTRGIARYTANFTAPTAPFPNQ
jgi:hypothetical protein